jgi:hypothetical protein
VESRDQEHGSAADDPQWTDSPAGASQWGSNEGGESGPVGVDAVRALDAPHPSPGSLSITGPAVLGTAQTPVGPEYGLQARVNGANPGHTGTAPPARPERIARKDARVRRRRRSIDDEFRRASLDEIFGEQPLYRAIFGLTAAWYALPTVIYLGWVAFASADSAREQLSKSAPWLLTAFALSIAVAGLLRWAVVGWRALTLSFAAAIIGGGVTTIAHSLAV